MQCKVVTIVTGGSECIFWIILVSIRFGSKLNKQIVGILLSTYCAPLVADLLLFYNEIDFMLSLSYNKIV